MKKVCIVENYSARRLEELINEWVDENPLRDIIDIKYSTVTDGKGVVHYTAMIIYKTNSGGII